jgi:hypothetical protein
MRGVGWVLSVLLVASVLHGCGNETANESSDNLPSPTDSSYPTSAPTTPSQASGTTIPQSTGSGTPSSSGTFTPSQQQTSTSPAQTRTRTRTRTTTKPPTTQTTTHSPPPPPTKNACGKPPTGRSPDGKALQRIVFQSPGRHQWPDTSVTLQACSTSGLPVRFELEEGGRGNKCWVWEPGSTTLRAQPQTVSCWIKAHQDGNGQYAPAETVTRTWVVGQLVVTSSWTSDSTVLLYRSSSPKVTLSARATAVHGIPSILVYVGATGSCKDPVAPERIGNGRATDIRFEVTVTLTDPGAGDADCAMDLYTQVDAAVTDVHDVRHYTVRSE